MQARTLRRTLLVLLAAMMLCASAQGTVLTEVSPLPWDESPGYEPNPEAFTQAGYVDASLRVDIVTVRRADADFHVARIKIKHASQLRTGIAKWLGSKTNRITTMAQRFQAVLAINGDYYSDRSTGLVIRQGITLREKTSKQYDVLLIDSKGDFHIVQRDHLEMLEVYLSGALDIRNVFSFGPALVIDGEKQAIPEKYSFAPHYKNPRAAIGQVGELEYLCVVVDGRSDDSAGATLETLAQAMADFGCIQAYNLDGGNSATLVLGGAITSDKSLNNERSVSDIIYFATSVDPINW